MSPYCIERILASFDNNAGSAPPPPVTPSVETLTGARGTSVGERLPSVGIDIETQVVPGEDDSHAFACYS